VDCKEPFVFGYPPGEIALLAGWIAGAGILVGILAGLFGIGGGAIIVPVLYEVFRVIGVPEDVRMQLCIGTSLAIIVPTTIRSYLAHKKRGAVYAEVVKVWAGPAVIGVAVGSLIATFAPPSVFKVAFVVFASFKVLIGALESTQFPGFGRATGDDCSCDQKRDDLGSSATQGLHDHGRAWFGP